MRIDLTQRELELLATSLTTATYGREYGTLPVDLHAKLTDALKRYADAKERIAVRNDKRERKAK